MLLGLCAYCSVPWLHAGIVSARPVSTHVISALLLLAGLWNSLWFGLRHLEQFWGIAALVSGIVMVMMSVLIAGDAVNKTARYYSYIQLVYRYIKPIAAVVNVVLLCSFILYAVTLVQLNLGMEIIR
ncbi:hypothetical protein ACVBE9_03910 [Eionea flava]